jgi:two-component system NtrC family sensor kinase
MDQARQGLSVRFRLLAIALLPMLVVLPILLGIAVVRWSEKFDKLLISKVNGDITIAHQYLSRILENSGEKIQAIGVSASFAEQLARNQKPDLTLYLEKSRQDLGFDFLYMINAEGEMTSSLPPTEVTVPVLDWPVVSRAIKGHASTVIDIFDENDLKALSPALAKQARMDLVPTKAAVHTERTVETRGMVVHTAAPVDFGGAKMALVGGILLNRNLQFIDTINDLVYREASLPEGSQGTATLFLEDVRVSTNVRLFENVRALGTRVSAIVRSTVLDEGKVWLDRAFVVNDWYISAYEPIVDSGGRRVGMLYVGFLEKPFQTDKYTTLAFIAIAFLLVTAITVPVFLGWVRGIFKPLERMAKTISKVEDGDLSARTGSVPSRGEISKVAQHLDILLGQLQQRDREQRNWAEELNSRVEERTSELKEANQRLEATTQQLIVSEKLAAIGEITAGIAHEINNPIAVIQGNLDVIREALNGGTSETETEFRLIDDQVHNIHMIVTKLLQFARPDEFAGYLDRQVPHEVLTDCLLLVQHLLNKVDIKVTRKHRSNREVLMNRTELQQVLINLFVNAIHAMPSGGELTLSTYDKDVDGQAGLVIEVSDTGKGIPCDVLKKVFDPFFTTKQSEGTGLGLSISQTLITRHGGRISASSEIGQGATFSVWMPEAE